ncbi:MAG: tRNA (adenosine(37)-N6)-threonylcarbamoyltransferase complex ATPase subunit type 1 TsaE, partial [Candidatus Omnitrophica bacterium]|nr:tRNA (adenosine(37)-N6)-threonylcarbamoyltransferase complex ATPase subunit type 1 TsaE [Candidatus Omnitrophota bacterium]
DKVLKLDSSSTAETIKYGQLFSKLITGAEVVVLAGALGGGKTTFAKGLVKGLGYRGRVLSPTFTLIRQYSAKRLKVYHADLYRLNKTAADDLGFEEFFYSKKSLTLIEWGDKIVKELPSYLEVKFAYLGTNRRRLSFSAVGCGREKILEIKKVFKNELISR